MPSIRILVSVLFCLALSSCALPGQFGFVSPTIEPEMIVQAEAPTATDTPTIAPTKTPTTKPTKTATPKPTRTPTATATSTSTPLPSPTPRPPTATPVITASLSVSETTTSQSQPRVPAGCRWHVDCIPTPAPPSVALEHTDNILLMGSDLRAGEGQWRTDTLLLVAIDWENNRIGVLSFPRDYWVHVPGHPEGFTYDRINRPDFVGDYYQYPGGGFALMQEVFQENFGIRLDRFARLHRQGFVDIVDILGGVDIELDCDLYEYSPTADGSGIADTLRLPAGPNHLDGDNALKFATYRYNSTDYDRSRRQQALLSAMREQFVRAGTLTQVPQLWGALQDYFKTNLGLVDLVRLASLVGDINMDNVTSSVIAGKDLESAGLPKNPYAVVSRGDAVFNAIETIFTAPPIATQAHRQIGCQ